ncbi:MAG TPA: DHHA1 domain-containing protein [Gemmatimonadales bacterium]|jgi:alanyl-tRNA synthetase
MTLRLYYTDSYLRDFDAAVVERANNGRRIYLDQTAFYPTSGGQPFDTGLLGGVEVVDVVDEGERVAHLLAAPLAGDERVGGSVSWERRFDHMQQHTGQHLLSAVLHELVGHATISVHFGRESSTLDLDAAALEHGQVVEAERRSNQLVAENRPVEVSFEDAGTASGLRKASGREGTLRIVTIHDLDRSACGGTHVRATGEIGPVLIVGTERVKKNIRLEFLCGARAVRRARADLDLLSGLAGRYSAAPEELPAAVDAQRTELKAALAARRELEEHLAALRARDLYAASSAGTSGVRSIIVREPTGPPERLRPLAQALAAMPRALFVGVTADPPALVVAASEDSGLDAGQLLKSALQQVGGRGGGNPRLGQGTAPSAAALEAAAATIMASS